MTSGRANKLGIGLYGNNGGHQIHALLDDHPDAEVVGFACMRRNELASDQQSDSAVREYASLAELLDDERVDVVSLCSPIRAHQAQEAMLCLRKGKHVYAEKPCALTEEELDAVVAVSQETGLMFREMAGTSFERPYHAIRRVVHSGVIGEVIQVFAQKSYPYHERRPQDELVDGGLIMQNGIHAVRFIEHAAAVRIKRVYAIETKLGNPQRAQGGELHMAASLMFELDNGGVASCVVNYLNQPGFGKWGNEHLRVFGTKGFVESVDGGTCTRLVVGDKDMGPIDVSEPTTPYFHSYLNSLLGKGEMPVSLEDELHCTRVVIRAKAFAEAHAGKGL